MKKLNKLFAILIAVLGVQTLSAQTWTASDVSAGTYYLYNVGADKFLCSGNNWGSHASVTEGGIPVTLAGSGNVYTISTAAIYADKYLNNVWMDGGSYDWTFEKVSDKVYKLKNGSNVLYWNGGTSTNTTFGTDPGTTASQWMLVTEEARVAALANATQGSPIDATFLIKNAYFAKGNGSYISFNNAWNVVSDLTNSTSWKGTSLTNLWGNDSGNEDACYAVEQYGKQFDNYQELQVPNGKYFMTAKGFYRGNVVPYIYANSEKCNLKAKGNIGDDNLPNAAKALSGSDYQLDGVTVVITNGSLRVGVKSDSSIDWCVFDDFKLVYYGKDLTLYENALSSAIEIAQSIDQAKLNVAITNNLNKEIANSQAALNDANKTVESLEKQATSLNAIIETANNSIAPYAALRSLIDLCTEYTQNSNANSTDALTTFQTAINTATTNGNAATSADAINAAYNTLESARQTYARNAVPVYPYPFDMTFMLPNTTFDSNTEGWTQSGGAGWMSAGNVECYNTTFEFSMEYEGLNQGSWEIQVDAFYRYGGYDDAEKAHNGGTEQLLATLYANNNTVAVKSIMEGANAAGDYGQKTAGGVYVPNWPDQCDTYFATGCYTNAIATVIADGKLKVGIKKETTQGSDWTIFDNFKLIYKGVDVTDLQNALSALITTAYAIKEEKMGTAESAALNTALDNADATVTNADRLSEMISNLQSAYDAAVPSIDLYATVLPYITKAEGVDASIATTYRNQYDNGTITETAETVFQKLEVATYNYVTNNFAYPVPLSDTWNSTGTNTHAATFSDEHWSGEARSYKNQHDGWGDPKQGYPANSWSIDFDQEVTLPAGEYVFKVAGRKSVDATLELVVTKGGIELGTVNDFPNGNAGLGINKAGAASFDANDPAGFAIKYKDNGEVDRTGYGWQWRYVRFVLDEEATVKVAVHAETSKIYNWVSFGDYTLQMTEETYLEANKGGLDAPTAAAKALVDTKPMGTAENTALKDALDLPVTTGAELLAKIEALETAVANANAWVTAYNEAKAPLVAALERFEADYNDAENGALDYMNKERWATAISMAQAAAEAKDVTDSYDGFEAATSNLVAALDAATVSVGEYADLKSAIENANTIINGGNIGDGPFQRPQSAVDALGSTDDEQAVYDAAEKDGEEVTSLTEALRKGSVIELNAPKEGARYNMVMSYAGWEHDGKAVTYLAGGRNDAGLYNIQYYAAPNANYAQAFTFTAVEGKTNCYTLSMTDVDGNERYVCTGVPYEGNTSQLRTTTNAEAALVVEVIATTTDGIHNLYNTEAKNYIGGQDAGFFTVNSHTTFRLQEAAKANVTLTFSSVGWATLILPFDAELPEGVLAYSCGDADETEGTLTLEEAESLKANTPYLMNSYGKEFTFSGYGLADKDSYTDGLFTGTYENYKTTNDGKTYVLQNINGEVAFYLVGEKAQPTVKPNRIYMTYDSTNGAAAPRFSFGRGEGTTSVDNMEPSANSQQPIVVYDLMGRKVTTMEKGGMYIVNGKKVVIR